MLEGRYDLPVARQLGAKGLDGGHDTCPHARPDARLAKLGMRQASRWVTTFRCTTATQSDTLQVRTTAAPLGGFPFAMIHAARHGGSRFAAVMRNRTPPIHRT